MRIYNQDKTQEIFDPDLTKGKLVESTLFISHHPEQEKVEGKTAEEVAKALLEAGEKVFLDEKKNCWYRVKEEYKNGGRWVEKIDGIREVPKKEAWDEYEDIYVYVPYTEEELKDIERSSLQEKYIPERSESLLVFARSYILENPPKDDESKLQVSGLYDVWKEGKYSVGDVCNYAGQTYECHTAHDNAVYPDINPDNPQTWANFWRPLHGKSVSTARPWVKPQYGTTDMYHTGEYMVYTDRKTYLCKSDTVYSPEEYAQAWEMVNEL